MAEILFERRAAFLPRECDDILALAAALPSQAGGVLGAGGYAPDPRIRNATTTFLARSGAAIWLYDRLDALFGEAAAALGVAAGAIVEPPQMVRYDVGGHFNTWHSDAGSDLHAARALSASIELSEPGDHDGGVLQIAPPRMAGQRTMPRGGAAFFPSRALHRVTPVTRGTRLALVVWATG